MTPIKVDASYLEALRRAVRLGRGFTPQEALDLLTAYESATRELAGEREARERLDRALRAKDQAVGALIGRMTPDQLEGLIP